MQTLIKFKIRFFVLFLVLSASKFVANAQSLPSKSEILADLQKTNQYYMDKNPETTTINSSKATWLNGSYFNGHMAFFDVFPSKERICYALQWGKNNSWNLGDRPKEADNQCVGQAYMNIFYAYGAKDTFMLSKIDKSVSNLVNRSTSDDWSWIDALYMAMPVLTRYGQWRDDDRYFEKLYALYRNTKVTRGLYNSTSGLWYRDKNYDPPYKTPDGKDCHWSRGNGWVFGAHVRTLMYLPENDSHRKEYIDTFKKMAKTLKENQRSDGFWNVSLIDPTDYPGPETSGTGFFLYGIAWGINNGYLDKDTYLPSVIKAWNGLISKALDTNGRIGYVQGVGLAPHSSQPVTFNSSRDYGEGNFLLAGSEVIKLATGELPIPEDFYVKKVTATSASTLMVSFFEPANKTTAENISNYSINNNVKVENAELSEDGMECELTLSNIYNGTHGISFMNIESASGKIIANGSGRYFLQNKGQTSGVKNTKQQTKLMVYPNPASQDYINIQLESVKNESINIRLFDTTGRLILQENIEINNNKHNMEISTQNLSKGLYLLNVSNPNMNISKKITIN